MAEGRAKVSRYRTISVKMWGDDRFSRLSRPNPNAQTLWVYLLTGPHTTALPGAFVAGEASLAEALGWPSVSLKKAFKEVLAEGLAEADTTTRLVFLPKALRHNPPQSPNVVIAWRKAFDELPDCALKQRIFECVASELSLLGKAEAFAEAFRKGSAYTFVESEQNRNRTGTEPKQKGMGRAASAATPPPEFLEITPPMAQLAAENGVSDIAGETEAMLDHFRAKGETRADWVATWRTWIRNSKRFGGSRGRHTETKADRNRQAAANLLSRFDSQDSSGGFGGDF